MLALLKGSDIDRGRRLAWRRRRLNLDAGQATRVSALLGLALVAGLTAILASPLYPGDASIAAGRPAPRDFQAPRAITFPSEILTEQKRQKAAEGVAPIYAAPNPNVAGQQTDKASQVLDYVELQRQDTHGDRAAHIAALEAVPELAGLSQDTLGRLLDLEPDAWDTVKSEMPAVVSQTMRETIRPDGVANARSRTITFVARDIDPVTSSLVAQMAAGFVTANTAVDSEKTDEARQLAGETVEPVMRSIAAGQIIAREGDILTPEAVEALGQLGLLRGPFGALSVVGTLLFALVMVLVSATTLARLQPGYWVFPRRVSLAVLLILLFTFGARYAVPGHLVFAYAYPAAAVAMTLTVLLGIETGLTATIVLAASVGALAGTGLETTVYILAGSLASAVVLGRVERFSAFFTAGAALAASNLAVIMAFHAPGTLPDLRGLAELSSAAMVNAALATGLAAVGYLTVGSMLGITTSLQLLELARPDHPLLRELQIKAPGTYHHSIVLSNLAEAAAQAIGANTLLVRVGAYYHDVGKTVRPYFFVENQVPGVSAHVGLDAHASARIIIAHVPDGAEMCREHGLPDDVVDFVWQHHGTTLVEYFYHQAVELLGEEAVDAENFRYPGPRPQTREAAILMLADGSEAAVRAASPESRDEIVDVVNRIIRRRLNAGELDDSSLTLRDLKVIRETFVSTLQSLYHPRIKYPEEVETPRRSPQPREGDADLVARAAATDAVEDGSATEVAPSGTKGGAEHAAEEHVAAAIVEDGNGSQRADGAGSATQAGREESS